MQDKEWLSLDPEQLGQERVERGTIEGVPVNARMSPYDVPAAVRGYSDGKTKRFIIEFKYIDDEPWKVLEMERGIGLRVARNSNRLVGIELNTKELRKQRVSPASVIAEIENAVRRLRAHLQSDARESNYAVASEVIAARQNQLLGDLADVR